MLWSGVWCPPSIRLCFASFSLRAWRASASQCEWRTPWTAPPSPYLHRALPQANDVDQASALRVRVFLSRHMKHGSGVFDGAQAIRCARPAGAAAAELCI
ncbi:hypothetical protein IE81DRAFT_81994 [Ceraceosorus guamensis]|uniref:Secreted protein n=1 Tax=Ceraceosorus guamensis TaxID=1522189 RepID=A0A316W841_9BASI|nr:hypothetical protein IE81DRAFT_81994 [Ceraceosorus guamensis]PWN46070.1 hypothetical protein IE81DRAFT_81994 [Ceraceosorus guamensis]